MALRADELPAGTDPDQLAFELSAIAMGVNHAIQLAGDTDAIGHARHAMQRLLAPA